MRYIKFKFPTIDITSKALNLYETKKIEYKKLGIITKNEMMSTLRREKIFTLDMQTELENIEGGDLFKYPIIDQIEKDEESRKIEKWIIEVIKGERVIDLVSILEKEEKENDPYARYRELTEIKGKYLRYTVEGLAEQQRTFYLLSECAYDAKTNTKIWKSYKDLLSSDRKIFITLLTIEFVDFLGGLNQTILRKLSRHHLWRSKWISATKIHCPVFSGNISEWDINKTFLCYWSNLLDNINGSSEPPEKFIIDDDKLLDSWLEAKSRDNKNTTKIDKNAEGVQGVFKTKVNPVKRRK